MKINDLSLYFNYAFRDLIRSYSKILSIIITFLMGAQMYSANIKENKVYAIILKEAKLFDDNINYQSSGNVDRGNKVLILDESEDMFLIKLLDGQSGWVEKNLIKILEIY